MVTQNWPEKKSFSNIFRKCPITFSRNMITLTQNFSSFWAFLGSPQAANFIENEIQKNTKDILTKMCYPLL